MSLYSAMAIYLLVWVLVFFMVLPLGIRSQHETGDHAEEGHDLGAPVSPRLGLKALQTSFIAFVVSVPIYGVVAYGYFDKFLYWLMPL